MLPLFIYLNLVLLIVCAVSVGLLCTVKSLFDISGYNTDLDIAWSCCDSQFFSHEILQRNYRKMTKSSFVKLSS